MVRLILARYLLAFANYVLRSLATSKVAKDPKLVQAWHAFPYRFIDLREEKSKE